MIGRKMKDTAFATRGELFTVALGVPQWVQNPNVQIKRETNDGNKNPARTNPGGAVKIPLLGDTMVKRRNKYREKSAIPIIPYFFLSVAGFSRYPEA